MANNLVDGFPMQGQATGKTLQVDVGGKKLSVASFSVTAQSSYNLAWLQGSMDIPPTLGKDTQDPQAAFKDYNTPISQFQSDSSWDDSKVKKVKLKFTSFLNDGEPGVDLTLEDCILFYQSGVCQFKCLKGDGKFREKSIIDFDGTDDSKETLPGSSLSVSAGH